MLRFLRVLSAGMLLCCIMLQTARAEEITTWAQCVKLAKKHNPDLLAAYAELKQTEEDLSLAYSNWYPQAGMDAGVRKSAESESYSAGVSVRQLIFDGFKTPASVGKAQAQLEKARSRFDKTSAAIRYSLKEAYIGLLKSNETLKLTEIIAARRKQNLGLVKLRYQAGREHAGSLLTAEADLAQAQFEVEQARRNNDLAGQKLATAVGLPGYFTQVAGDFDIQQDITQKPDIPALVITTPEVRESTAGFEMARWSVQSAYADLYPSIYLSASAGLEDDHWFPEESRLSGGISLSLPLFEGGARLAAITKAGYALKQAESVLKSQQDGIRLELEQKWKNLQDAAGQIGVQKMYLQAAQARAKIANAQYSSGLVAFDDWAIIEDRLVNAQKSYLNSQAELLLAEAQWILTKGEGLDHE